MLLKICKALVTGYVLLILSFAEVEGEGGEKKRREIQYRANMQTKVTLSNVSNQIPV